MKYSILLFVLLSFTACNEHAVKHLQVRNINLPYYNSADFTPQWLDNKDTTLQHYHSIQSFNFIDQEGAYFSSDAIKNKIVVADFFFTACPGICKTLTANLKEVQQNFANDSSIMILSHSVTPDLDNVSRLKQYASNFGIHYNQWKLLTGDKKAIYNIARQSYFADEDLGLKRTENDFLHTENVVLIDKHQHIRGVYKGTSILEIKDLIEDIKTLQEEEE